MSWETQVRVHGLHPESAKDILIGRILYDSKTGAIGTMPKDHPVLKYIARQPVMGPKGEAIHPHHGLTFLENLHRMHRGAYLRALDTEPYEESHDAGQADHSGNPPASLSE